MEHRFERAAARGSAEAVLRQLTEAIVSGMLREGDRLPPEEQLAGDFGVAVMTLRQALSALRSLGYVETKRGRNGGTYVSDDVRARLKEAASKHQVTVEEIRELSDWRRAISGEACALAAERVTKEELRELMELANDFVAAARVSKNEARMTDARLHARIAEISGCARIAEAEREIQESLSLIIMSTDIIPEAKRSYLHGHDILIEAIGAGDADAARRQMIAHVESTNDWCASMLLH